MVSRVSTLSPISGPHCQTLSLQSRLTQKTNRAGGNLESLQVFSFFSLTIPSLRAIIADLLSLCPRRCQSFSTAGPSLWWEAPNTTQG